MSNSIDQQFVAYIVKALVTHPEDVVVERTVDERGVLLQLKVNPVDLGRVIGRNGSTAQSIRSLLRTLGLNNDARYNLKIVDVDRVEVGENVAQNSSNDNDIESSSEETVDNSSDRVKTTRKELADLDDLDI